MAPAVVVNDLVKRYPKARTNAVDGLGFRVYSGEIFGLLGRNGAGKTTTVGILTTRVRPTSGTALVADVDVAADPVAARGESGRCATAGQFGPFAECAAEPALACRVSRCPPRPAPTACRRAAGRMGLADKAKARIDDLSGGQAQRRFQVLCALNPLTYVREGMRGALLPGVPHIAPWICVLALLLAGAVFGALGIKLFLRRALD